MGTMDLQGTANSVLTVCLSQGDNRNVQVVRFFEMLCSDITPKTSAGPAVLTEEESHPRNYRRWLPNSRTLSLAIPRSHRRVNQRGRPNQRRRERLQPDLLAAFVAACQRRPPPCEPPELWPPPELRAPPPLL
jgi:hypothetical protein